MTIINPLGYTINNGDPIDATPVQANFNQVVSNVNSNAAAVAGNPSQEFLVASTANPAGAVPLAQLGSLTVPISTTSTLAGQSITLANNYGVWAKLANGTAASLIAITSDNWATVYSADASTGARVLNAAKSAGVWQTDNSGNTIQLGTVQGAPATQSYQQPTLGQTVGGGANNYTDVTASRALGTTYTNTSGRPLYVCAYLSISNLPGPGFARLTGIVNGVTRFNADELNGSSTAITAAASLSMIVPPTASFSINLLQSAGTTSSLTSWIEY